MTNVVNGISFKFESLSFVFKFQNLQLLKEACTVLNNQLEEFETVVKSTLDKNEALTKDKYDMRTTVLKAFQISNFLLL